MLNICNISHFYEQVANLALKEINTAFAKNTMTAIVGPNGAGKSTLLKIIANIIKPKSGNIKIDGDYKIAYLPQHSALDKNFPFRVNDVICMGLWPKLPNNSDKLTKSALKQVGLEGYDNKHIGALSGGQFQRMLFARMILQDADILLLDEPFNAIDAHTTSQLIDVLRQYNNKTIIAVMHDLCLVGEFFPQTLILANKIIAHGNTKDVLIQENLIKAAGICHIYE